MNYPPQKTDTSFNATAKKLMGIWIIGGPALDKDFLKRTHYLKGNRKFVNAKFNQRKMMKYKIIQNPHNLR